MQGAGVPVHHALGNHCLRRPRNEVQAKLGMPASYYAARLGPGWTLLVLDTTELSGHGAWPEVRSR